MSRKKTIAPKSVRRRKPEPPVEPVRHTPIELALLSLLRLELNDPYQLAAFIDWIRQEWKAQRTMVDTLDENIPSQVRMIEMMALRLRSAAIAEGGNNAVRAAVTA